MWLIILSKDYKCMAKFRKLFIFLKYNLDLIKKITIKSYLLYLLNLINVLHFFCQQFLLVTKDGIKIFLRPDTSDFTSFSEVFIGNEYNLAFFRNDFSEYEVFNIFDLGANVGAFTLYALSIISCPYKIISVEPDKNNFFLLKKNIRENGLKNVSCLNSAVYSKNKKVFLESKDLFFRDSFKVVESLTNNKRCAEIKAVTLGFLFNKYKIDKLHLLKIDIEGSEFFLLNNENKIFFKKTLIILLEYHLFNDDNEKVDIKNYFEGLNFALVHHQQNSKKQGLMYFKNEAKI